MANEKPLSEYRCKIILALAESKMNVSEVARRLYMCRGTVDYQINKIRQLTGKDPLNFYDLYELTLCAKAERTRKWIEKQS